MEETILTKGLLSKMTATSNEEGEACFKKKKKIDFSSLLIVDRIFFFDLKMFL